MSSDSSALERSPQDHRLEREFSRGDSGYPRFIARRLLRARGQGWVSLISAISAGGFILGVAALIVTLALMTGFQYETYSRIIGASAHIWLWPAEGPDAALDLDAIEAKIGAVPGVIGSEPVVEGLAALVPNAGTVQWTQLQGVEPERAGKVTSLAGAVISGSFQDLAPGSNDARPTIVLGERLARKLGVSVGDALSLIVPQPRMTFWGASVRQRSFRVCALFRTGYEEFDGQWSVIHLQEGRSLFGLRQGVHRIAVKTSDVTRVAAVADRLRSALGPDWVVTDVNDTFRSLFAALRLEKLMLFLAIGMIVVVAAFGVVSTLVLTVSQKVRLIGVLSAMGATPAGTMRIFIYQGLAMGGLGSLAGMTLGVGACWVMDRFQLIKLDPTVYFIDHLPFRLLWTDVAATVLSALLVAIAATLYPAWKAGRMDPVEALRHE